MTVPVALTRPDLELAIEVALARMDAGAIRQAEGVTRKKLSDFEIEYMGMMAEIAACRFYGVQPYTTIHKRRADGGADLTVEGRTVDVKSSHAPPDDYDPKKPHLLVANPRVPYDTYLLVYAKPGEPIVMLIGQATREEVLAKPYERFLDGANLMCRAVPRNELAPI